MRWIKALGLTMAAFLLVTTLTDSAIAFSEFENFGDMRIAWGFNILIASFWWGGTIIWLWTGK